jgi:hypothetical protein
MLQALVEALRYTSRFKLIEEIKHLKTFGMHERCTDNPSFFGKKNSTIPKENSASTSLAIKHTHFSTEQILENHLKMSQPGTSSRKHLSNRNSGKSYRNI